jgi:hypothetical protein
MVTGRMADSCGWAESGELRAAVPGLQGRSNLRMLESNAWTKESLGPEAVGVVLQNEIQRRINPGPTGPPPQIVNLFMRFWRVIFRSFWYKFLVEDLSTHDDQTREEGEICLGSVRWPPGSPDSPRQRRSCGSIR